MPSELLGVDQGQVRCGMVRDEQILLAIGNEQAGCIVERRQRRELAVEGPQHIHITPLLVNRSCAHRSIRTFDLPLDHFAGR